MIESPCHFCKERVLGCHSICDKYKKFRAKCDEINKEKRKDNAIKDVEYYRDLRITAHTGRSNK